jgi:hypothetical protein
MKSILPEWYGHDDKTIKRIITTGTIALDANVLLDLYRVGKNQREQIISVLTAVRDRIFVPYQVALEFHQKRLHVAGTNVSAYADLLRSVDVVLEEKVLSKIRGGLQKEVRQIVEIARKDLADKLTEWHDRHIIPFDEVRKDDPVLKALDELLDDSAFGKRPSYEELEELKATAHERYKSLIPPGYSDVGEKEDPTGDYLVWSELLEHAKTANQPLLFVTSDKKEDWYRPAIRGQSLGPRIELIAEMRSVLDTQPYHQVPLDLFLDLTNAYLDTSVENATIEIVRSITRPTRDFKLQFLETLPASEAEKLLMGLSVSEVKMLTEALDLIGPNAPSQSRSAADIEKWIRGLGGPELNLLTRALDLVRTGAFSRSRSVTDIEKSMQRLSLFERDLLSEVLESTGSGALSKPRSVADIDKLVQGLKLNERTMLLKALELISAGKFADSSDAVDVDNLMRGLGQSQVDRYPQDSTGASPMSPEVQKNEAKKGSAKSGKNGK